MCVSYQLLSCLLLIFYTHLSEAKLSNQVASLCDWSNTYFNQYVNTEGHWSSDTTSRGCLQTTQQVLQFCQSVYPSINVRHVIKSIHRILLGNWTQDQDDTITQRNYMLHTYRCLDESFQSDALLVPQNCQFSHLHNTSMCGTYHGWHQIAEQYCTDRGSSLKSDGVLAPCDVDMFSGVEMVCCAIKQDAGDSITAHADLHKYTTHLTVSTLAVETSSLAYDRPAYSSEVNNINNSIDSDHNDFVRALKSEDRSYTNNVLHIMNRWRALEDNYDRIKLTDPKKADIYRQRLSHRFRQLMNSLKQNTLDKKHQLIVLHQRRVVNRINSKKHKALMCVIDSLNEVPPLKREVEKCMRHFLHAIFYDRHHTIAQFYRLLKKNESQAMTNIEVTGQHIRGLCTMTVETMQLLTRYKNLTSIVLPKLHKLLQSLIAQESIPSQLAKYESYEFEYDDDEFLDQTLRTVSSTIEGVYQTTESDIHDNNPNQSLSDIIKTDKPEPRSHLTILNESRMSTPSHREILPPKNSHMSISSSHVFQPSHFVSQLSTTSIQSSVANVISNSSVLLGVALFVLFATICVTVIIIVRRRHSPTRQGFSKVAQATSLENAHLKQMKMNGYENPTYKYFESMSR